MSVCLATLCLNEMEWLPRLYKQHRHWPSLKKWVFVESADRVYAETNPTKVTSKGLSIDGTSEYLEGLAKHDPRIVYIPFGFSEHPTDEAQNKCVCRQAYLDEIEQHHPELFVVVDADEFYPQQYQQGTNLLVAGNPSYNAFVMKHREVWRPPAISHFPLFRSEVVGGFWDVLYCRTWRWEPHLQYVDDHNTPQCGTRKLTDSLRRPVPGDPYFVHLGFTSKADSRSAKHNYYVARGEGRTDHRQMYVDSRASYLTWHPITNPKLPGGAQVIPYRGLIPEVFQDEGS